MDTPGTLSVLDLQLLLQLGERLKTHRQRQRLGTVQLAQRAGIARDTLYNIEYGDPQVSMGNYLRVMSALGISADLALLGGDALQSVHPQSAAGRSRRPMPQVQVTVSTTSRDHQAQDLQSLALHTAAVQLLKEDPALIDKARALLDRWLRDNPDSRSAELWRQWAEHLNKRRFSRILGRSAHAQQMRQASPLPHVLPAATRAAILNDVSQLKKGVKQGAEPHRAPG
ncbi:MAG: helix-turn-helix domain-containing protein [Rhodoferax sp.]